MYLPLSDRDIDNILNVYHNSNNTFKPYIMRLFVTLILLKDKIITNENNAINFIKKIWNRKDRSDYY